MIVILSFPIVVEIDCKQVFIDFEKIFSLIFMGDQRSNFSLKLYIYILLENTKKIINT